MQLLEKEVKKRKKIWTKDFALICMANFFYIFRLSDDTTNHSFICAAPWWK